MNIVVHKYVIDPEKIDVSSGVIVLELPVGAVALCVHEQRDQMCLWASHQVPADDAAPWIQEEHKKLTPRRFVVLPTGVAREWNTWHYIGSVFLYGASHVFHVFEIL